MPGLILTDELVAPVHEFDAITEPRFVGVQSAIAEMTSLYVLPLFVELMALPDVGVTVALVDVATEVGAGGGRPVEIGVSTTRDTAVAPTLPTTKCVSK